MLLKVKKQCSKNPAYKSNGWNGGCFKSYFLTSRGAQGQRDALYPLFALQSVSQLPLTPSPESLLTLSVTRRRRDGNSIELKAIWLCTSAFSLLASVARSSEAYIQGFVKFLALEFEINVASRLKMSVVSLHRD